MKHFQETGEILKIQKTNHKRLPEELKHSIETFCRNRKAEKGFLGNNWKEVIADIKTFVPGAKD